MRREGCCGDAYFVGGHGADDDAFGHHGLEDGVTITDFDENEVRVTWHVLEV